MEVCHLQSLSFVLRTGHAAFDVCDATIKSQPFKFALISRRSRYRAGTRYFRRGIDEKGNVANYNETEQIVIVNHNSDDTTILSFVQTRGSIPLFWAEINNLRYKPDLQIMELEHTVSLPLPSPTYQLTFTVVIRKTRCHCTFRTKSRDTAPNA